MSDQAGRALDGVRVLDLTHQVAGPSATLMLAFLGAEVVKVIAPGNRDSYDAIAFYLNNASKKSVELDLKSEPGREAALRLADRADIFVENFSPGVIERLGLSWDVLSARNPRLIYAQVKGFAEDSPYRDFPCFDPIAQGFSGGSSITGEPDGLPMKPGPDVGDTGTGMVLAGAILAALYQRERDGLGQRVQIAMTDQVATFMRIHYGWPIERRMDTPRFGNRSPFLVTTAPSDIYPCSPFGPSDYVHIHCGSDRQWERMAKVIGREDLLGDPRFATMASRGVHRAEVDEAVRGWTGTLDKLAAMAALGAAGVPAGALRSTTEVLDDTDLRDRGIFVTVDDPGRGEMTIPGYPVRMSRSTARVTPPPQPGQHTAQVLRDWLGESTAPGGSGFTGGVLGLLLGKPCPQDVPGGVDVGVGLVAAGQTSELRLADAVPRRRVPAFGAPLGGVAGVDCDDCPPGAFSLGGQDSQEEALSRIVDGLVQAGFGRRAVRLVAGSRSLFPSARCAGELVSAAMSPQIPDSDRLSRFTWPVRRDRLIGPDDAAGSEEPFGSDGAEVPEPPEWPAEPARGGRGRTPLIVVAVVGVCALLGGLAAFATTLGGSTGRSAAASALGPGGVPAGSVAGKDAGRSAASGGPHANPFSAAITSYLAAREGIVTAAVYDMRTGQTWTLGQGQPQATASIVKVDILETLLASNPDGLPAADQALAQSMIEDSDNDAATALWNAAGGPTGLGSYNASAGLRQTTPSACLVCAGFPWPGWGLTTTTPADQVLLLRQVFDGPLLSRTDRDYARSLMENVESGQRWGISAGVPAGVRIALKNGWVPLTESDSDWQINSEGWISGVGRDYLVSVLATGNPSEQYGIDTIDTLSASLWKAMG